MQELNGKGGDGAGLSGDGGVAAGAGNTEDERGGETSCLGKVAKHD